MPIKNNTVYDIHAIRALTVFTALKNKRIRILLTTLLGSLGLALCVFGIVMAGLRSVYTLLAALLLALLTVLGYRWFFAAVARYKRDGAAQNIAMSYEFYQRDFVARSARVGAKGNTVTRYSTLADVYETKDYIYLYLDHTNAFLVRRSAFSDHGAALLDLLRREVDDGRLHLLKKKKA